MAEIAETTISGAEVPNPTITIPIRSVDMPQNLATPTAPSTNLSALHTRTPNPRTIATIGRIINY
jgi:hypothetical protein